MVTSILSIRSNNLVNSVVSFVVRSYATILFNITLQDFADKTIKCKSTLTLR